MLPIKEPSRVEKQRERSFGFGVVLQKVLSEYLLNGGRVLFIETTVGHGTSTASHVFDGGHWNFPHSCKCQIVSDQWLLLTYVMYVSIRLGLGAGADFKKQPNFLPFKKKRRLNFCQNHKFSNMYVLFSPITS